MKGEDQEGIISKADIIEKVIEGEKDEQVRIGQYYNVGHSGYDW